MSMGGETQEENVLPYIEQELMNLTEQIKQRISAFFEQQNQIDAQFTENLSLTFSSLIGPAFTKLNQLGSLKEENARLMQILTENRNLHVEIQKHLAARKEVWADPSSATQDIN